MENKTLCNLSFNQILFISLHLKNHQKFKGDMTNEYTIGATTLKQRIEAMSLLSIVKLIML